MCINFVSTDCSDLQKTENTSLDTNIHVIWRWLNLESDFAGFMNSRKSISEYGFLLNGGDASWKGITTPSLLLQHFYHSAFLSNVCTKWALGVSCFNLSFSCTQMVKSSLTNIFVFAGYLRKFIWNFLAWTGFCPHYLINENYSFLFRKNYGWRDLQILILTYQSIRLVANLLLQVSILKKKFLPLIHSTHKVPFFCWKNDSI